MRRMGFERSDYFEDELKETIKRREKSSEKIRPLVKNQRLSMSL